MTLEATDEVRTIKQSLQEKEGIQVDQIRLIYSGKQLADDKKIEDYNITAGASLSFFARIISDSRRHHTHGPAAARRQLERMMSLKEKHHLHIIILEENF